MTATLLDIVNSNQADEVAGIVEEATLATPEVTGRVNYTGEVRQVPGVGDAYTLDGIKYSTLVRTALPSVGFRKANEGTAPTKSTRELRDVETYIMNPRWDIDKAIADRDKKGPFSYLAEEAVAHLEAGFISVGKQFYYGTDPTHGLADGFPGLLQGYDAANMVVDAGGTTAATGSSVWAVRFGRQDVRWVWGMNGEFAVSDIDVRDVEDASGNKYSAFFQEMHAYPGLQILSTQCVGRIKKLTADSGKGLTDALISQLLAKFKVGKYPHALFASRRSIAQLQASRTATTTTGAPAPWPTEAFGVPLIPTESISDVESLTL